MSRCLVALLLVVLGGLHVSLLDVLPLSAAVDVVPDLVRGGVERQLEAESGAEDGEQHGRVAAEDRVVDSAEHARHFGRVAGAGWAVERDVMVLCCRCQRARFSDKIEALASRGFALR